ncbi:MAG TPA: hypothetical protein VF984_10850 [Actinomycetota bacterium]
MRQAERAGVRPSVQLVSAVLGVAVLVLAVIESLRPGGAGPVLPHAAALTAGHWAIGIALAVGALGDRTAARILLLSAAVALLATGVTALVAGPWLGNALGLADRVPVAAGVLHLVLGLLAAAGSFLPSRAIA